MSSRVSSLFEDEDLLDTSSSMRGQRKPRGEIRTHEAEQPQLRASPEVRAEALYWCAITHLKLGNRDAAYRMFRELAWDYPGSKWARFAIVAPFQSVLQDIEPATNRANDKTSHTTKIPIKSAD